jgi:hypothetical protein
MITPSLLDEISKNLSNLIPPEMQMIKDDFEKNARLAVQSALGKLDLVTREEFDVQSAVLAKTREKLEALEKLVAELDQK